MKRNGRGFRGAVKQAGGNLRIYEWKRRGAGAACPKSKPPPPALPLFPNNPNYLGFVSTRGPFTLPIIPGACRPCVDGQCLFFHKFLLCKSLREKSIFSPVTIPAFIQPAPLSRSLRGADELSERPEQRVGLDRLAQVRVQPCLEAPLHVLVEGVRRQRDDRDTGGIGTAG